MLPGLIAYDGWAKELRRVEQEGFAGRPNDHPGRLQFKRLVGGAGLELLDVRENGLIDVRGGESRGVGGRGRASLQSGQAGEVDLVLEFLGLLHPTGIDDIGGNGHEVGMRDYIRNGLGGEHWDGDGRNAFGGEGDLSTDRARSD